MMAKNIDLKEEFRKYFNELEGYGVRSERFYEERESAFIAGARAMAQDTLDTLSDYACACAGLEPELIKPETVYDRARHSLHVYYPIILDKAEPKYSDIVSDGGMDPRNTK
jgi:hypothetical protein